MKRTIKNTKPLNIDGKPIRLPVFDEQGKPIYEPVLTKDNKVELAEDGSEVKNLKMAEGSLAKCLAFMVNQFPREMLTTAKDGERKEKQKEPYTPLDHVTYGRRLRLAADVDDGEDFELGGKTFDWTLYVLKHEKVGLAIFGMNVLNIVYALDSESMKQENEDADN